MTLVTGTVQDLGYDGMEGTLWARPARFRSDGSVVYAPERKPFTITGGVVSAELAPGPAVLELQVGSHARGTFEVVIPDTDITLADLLDTVFPWEPAQVSQFVAERELAVQAKTAAETAAGQASTAAGTATTAAQQTGQDRTAVAADKQVVVGHVQALAAPNDAAVLGLISEGATTQTKAALNATYASAHQSLLPPTLASASIETSTHADPKFVDYWGGYMWGFTPGNGYIFRSNDEGHTWSPYCNSFNGPEKTILRIIPTADGEVLVLCPHGLFKSSGWAGGNSASWSASKVTMTGTGGIFDAFSVDGDGQKFILGEYGYPQERWADSRYGYISTDAGTTWARRWDSDVHAGLSDPGESHIHAVCYDPFSDRFYVSEGHGPGGGVYTSTDDGATWTRHPGMQPPAYLKGEAFALNNGPTVIVATNDGLVMGSDNSPENGLFGVAREADPSKEVMKQTWAFKTGLNGLHTFAQRGWRDPQTGQVFVTFRAEYADTPIVIAAGTAHTGGLVYAHTLPSLGGYDRFMAVAKTSENRLVAFVERGAAFTPGLLRGTLTRPGGVDISLSDTGNILGGTATKPNASASGAGSQAREERASASGIRSLASGFESTAEGYLASAKGIGAVAVGANTTADYVDSVAVGRGSKPKQSAEIDLGARHLALRARTLPILPDPDSASLALVKNAQGQEQLVVQFNTGAQRVLATRNGARFITTDTILSTNDSVVFAGATPMTVTLPAAPGRNGATFTVKNTSAGPITLASQGGQIDGAASKTLASMEFWTVMSSGTNWFRIG